MKEIEVEILHCLILADTSSGKMFWKERPLHLCKDIRTMKITNTRYAGKECGKSTDKHGYLEICIMQQHYRSHRVIWAMHYGEWPDGEIDHINGIRTDNRIENLRTASKAQNQFNRGPTVKSTSGIKGVYPSPTKGKWVAEIRVKGRRICLGTFNTKELAAKARSNAEVKYHGEFMYPTVEDSQ